MKKFLFFIIISAAFSCGTPINGTYLSSIGFYSSKDAILEELSKKDNGYGGHYLTGMAYKKNKDYKNAIVHFANAAFSSKRDITLKHYPQPVFRFVKGFSIKSDFYDDSVYELAWIYLQYKEFESVIKFSELVSKKQKSLYRDAAILKSQALAGLKRYDEALSTIKSIEPEFSDKHSKGLLKIRAASIYEKSGDFSSALSSYYDAMSIDEKEWFSQLAASKVMEIAAKNNIEIRADRKASIAKSLYHSKKYKEAAAFISDEKPAFLKDSEYLAKIFARTGDTLKMGNLLGSIKEKSLIPALKKAYADELYSMKRYAQAVQTYSEIISAGIEPVSRESMEKTALYMEDKKIAGFEKYLGDYIKKYPESPQSENFLWLLGRNSIKSKNYNDAKKYFETALEKFPEGNYSDRCRFWLYKILYTGGDIKGADKIIKEITAKNPDSSYAWILMERESAKYKMDDILKGFESAVSGGNKTDIVFYHTMIYLKDRNMAGRNSRITKMPRSVLSVYKDFEADISGKNISLLKKEAKILEKYFSVGDSASIKRELKMLPEGDDVKKEKFMLLASLGKKYGNYYYALHSSNELLKLKKIRENINIFSDDTVRILLPKGFSECVETSSKEFGVDHLSILSIIKAESLFDQRAVSSAKATGLMQLMPQTAAGVARELKIQKYSLKDPCISIRLGTRYMATLEKTFKGRFDLVAAGYNAGPGNAKKWTASIDMSDIDYFHEFIPFVETRYYVLRTGRFLRQYNLVYGKKG